MSKKSTVNKASRTKTEVSDPDNPELNAAELRTLKRVAPIKRITVFARTPE